MTEEQKKKKKEEYLNSLEETILRAEMSVEYYEDLVNKEKDKKIKAQYGLKLEQLKREINFNQGFVDYFNA